jgi:hypothetical protein
MANSREQEQLSLQLCITAIMQKEELPDSRNRQAAETKGGQNEGQIWQRCMAGVQISSRSKVHNFLQEIMPVDRIAC